MKTAISVKFSKLLFAAVPQLAMILGPTNSKLLPKASLYTAIYTQFLTKNWTPSKRLLDPADTHKLFFEGSFCEFCTVFEVQCK